MSSLVGSIERRMEDLQNMGAGACVSAETSVNEQATSVGEKDIDAEVLRAALLEAGIVAGPTSILQVDAGDGLEIEPATTTEGSEMEGVQSQPVVPFVGMEFFSEKEVRVYYNRYAKNWGFGTKVSSCKRSNVTKEAYKKFGDCIVFDTTYCTNKYNLPFAPIIRVSNHGQTVLFGCVFLKNEKVETFQWVFETFLKAMDGKEPQCIMTDQDKTMEIAIAKVLPRTIHRCCMWHVHRNASTNLGVLLNGKEGFETDLKSCIDNSLNEEEFDASWDAMFDRHELCGNKYIQHLYDNRKKWVPYFFMDYFFPFMSTSQRS
jgi:hypothetical protein